MNVQEKIILEKDVVLPKLETIQVYNLGTPEIPQYVVTEKTAKYRLSTHKECEKCGSVYGKNSYCDFCYSKSVKERYWKKTFKEWDFETPLVIYNSDIYFIDADEVESYIEENDIDPKDLNLMICSPNYCIKIEDTYFIDDMPEEYDCLSDFDKGLAQKVEEINKYISTLKPVSWSEGNYRTEYKPS